MAGMAIVGMSCRFPGAVNIDEFWKILMNAEPQFSAVPANRWDHSVYHRPGDFREPHGVYTDQVAFLPEADRFAPAHYGIPPRRARAMDPQAKLFVDLAREAIQDAGTTGQQADVGQAFATVRANFPQMPPVDPAIPGASSVRAVIALYRPGLVTRCSRSPRPELATWS